MEGAYRDVLAKERLAGTDWGRLSPLPKVNVHHRGKGHSFEELSERYSDLMKEPLLVRGMLGTPYIPAEPDGSIHLDGLLAAMVVDTHPVAPFFESEACVVPLPLSLEWVSPEGLPLWVCSDLRPQGDLIRSQEYWHKRYPEDRHDEVKKGKLPNPRAGRNKEMRVPLATVRTPELRAICIGNAPEVVRLLSELTHVGKKNGSGFGRVLEWKVARLDQDSDVARQAALRARPVPARYLMDVEGEMRLTAGMNYMRRGWTVPYWFSPNHDLAVVREP